MSRVKMVRVGDVATQVRGVSYDKSEARNRPLPGHLPIVRANNITEFGLTYEGLVYVPERRVAPRQILQPGDIVIAASSGSIDVVGKAAPVSGGFTGSFGAFCKVIRPNRDVDHGYLAHFFKTPSYRRRISSLAAGVNINNLRSEHIDELQIPFPPIDEQRRIAAMLDKAEELRAKRRAAIALLDQLPQAIFLKMFGDPGTNLKNWPIRTIEETTECLDRFRKPVKASNRPDGSIPYYGANGLQGWIDRALFNESLVLVAEDGGHFENPTRGVAYRIDGPAWVNNHAHILRAKANVLDVEFLHRALRHYNFVPFISGTTRSKLTQGQLAKATIPVPPIDLQRRFAASVESTNHAKAIHHCALAESDALFASLLGWAFDASLK